MHRSPASSKVLRVQSNCLTNQPAIQFSSCFTSGQSFKAIQQKGTHDIVFKFSLKYVFRDELQEDVELLKISWNGYSHKTNHRQKHTIMYIWFVEQSRAATWPRPATNEWALRKEKGIGMQPDYNAEVSV